MVREVLHDKKNYLIKFSRIGIASKGVIYCILGIITIMGVTGYKNNKLGKGEVFRAVLEQPFGKYLLILLAVGLLGYVVWCIIKSIKDPYDKGNDFKGILARTGYLWSGIIYFSIALLAFKLASGNGSSKSGDESNEKFVSKLLQQPMGELLVGLIAVAIIIYGLYQIYIGVTERFLKNIKEYQINSYRKRIYRMAGKTGYIARGIVFAVIGYLFINAALHSNASEAKGSEGAFRFIGESFGPALLGIIALGLFAYGIFMFVKSKYAEISF